MASRDCMQRRCDGGAHRRRNEVRDSLAASGGARPASRTIATTQRGRASRMAASIRARLTNISIATARGARSLSFSMMTASRERSHSRIYSGRVKRSWSGWYTALARAEWSTSPPMAKATDIISNSAIDASPTRSKSRRPSAASRSPTTASFSRNIRARRSRNQSRAQRPGDCVELRSWRRQMEQELRMSHRRRARLEPGMARAASRVVRSAAR